MRFFIILLLLFLSSCIQMIGDPEPIRYYLLEGLPNGTKISSDKDLTINIQLINFPEYLDRPQVITQSNNSVSFSDHDHWAEPLQENLTRVLRENLQTLLPNASITVSPWESSPAEAARARITVNKFSGKLDGLTDVDIRWTVETKTEELQQGHFTDQQPVGDTYQELVAGLNSGINKFSTQLAKKLSGE